ncbi:MAG TPA: hypothetical protein VMF06_09755 [Candidatus Limnocylindria bacterium]|jgi:hypothetical protein|nr:hypothetical protein [Candidatus Limnocylindria bacterium]
MRKVHPIVALLVALLVGAALFATCYWMASRTRLATGRHQADDLAWLCHEFQLDDAQMAPIRVLHEGYKPRCEALCAQLAAKNRDIANALNGATNVSPEIEHKLAEAGAIRAECQAEMLRHFQAVARTMPGSQGARYLSEMQRLTLGEQSHSENAMPHPHP